jgi:Flp pilus assembly protein TadD
MLIILALYHAVECLLTRAAESLAMLLRGLRGVLVFWGVLFLAITAPPLAVRAAAQNGTQPFETQLALGIRLLSQGQLHEAVGVLNGAKQIAPQDPRPYFYSGIALAQSGNLRDAASELGEAVHLAPGQPDYRVFQANVLEQLKQKFAAQDALAMFQNQQALQQLDRAWLQLLVEVYYRLQKADDALRVLDFWSKLDPDDARIDLYRGQAYVLKGQTDEAVVCLRRSVEESPNHNGKAYFELGKILYAKSELVPAKAALISAVRDDTNNPEYLSKLASVCVAMGEAKAAIDYLRPVEAAGAAAPEVYYVLARAYHKDGQPALSAKYMSQFQQATSAQRDREERTLEAGRPIAQAQRQLDEGNTAAARVLFEKALEVDANQWEPNAYLAEMYVSSGELRQAYPYLQKLQQIDPESAIGNFLMARYCFKQREYDRARVYAEKVRVSRPANSELMALLGDIDLQRGEKQKALQEYQEAVHLAPSRTDLQERIRKISNGMPAPDQFSEP